MLRKAIVNSALGRFAVDLRDRLELHRAIGANLEGVGTAANDMLARVLVERLCADGAVFIDVGAHIGSVINGVRRNSSPGRIVAVEAIPAKAEALRANFPEIIVHACAVGASEGEISFFIDELRPGFSSLDPELAERSRTRQITVPIRTLDSLVPPGDVDLIKIDVEGAELGVLQGAGQITDASRPSFMFESGAGEMKGFTKADLWIWFQQRGYCILVPNRLGHFDPGLTLEGFLEAHLYPRRTTNYFAVAAERRDGLRLRARQVLNFA